MLSSEANKVHMGGDFIEFDGFQSPAVEILATEENVLWTFG